MSKGTRSKNIRKIVALLFAFFIALTGMAGIAFADVEAGLETSDPVIENTVEPDIVFTITGESGYGNWLFLPQWIPVTNADLLSGVSAVDENGDPVVVNVVNVGGLDLSSPQPAEGFPPTPYVITYEAVHPVTGVVYTVTRDAFVTAGIEPLALPAPNDNYTVFTGPPPLYAYTSGSTIQPPLPTPLPPPPPSPDELAPGQVIVGKSIVYGMDSAPSPNGTITVTLSAWATTYVDSIDGQTYDPLVPMTGAYNGIYAQVTDNIGELVLASGYTYSISPTPAGTSISLNPTTGIITWNITDQSLLLGTTPFEVTYTLTVDDPSLQPYIQGYWYSTGIANTVFQPRVGNPYYYTLTETTENAFTLSMNWNNGTGLNSGGITDNELGITIIFPKNNSAIGLGPYNSDGTMNLNSGWNYWPQTAGTQSQAATVVTPSGTQRYSWQLWWTSGSPKTYIFTIKDLAGAGKDVQYSIEFPTGGGNQAFAGDKIILSQDYFQKTFNSNQDDPFQWNGAMINIPINVMGEIMLLDENIVIPKYTLNVSKAFGGSYDPSLWGINSTTPFYVRVRIINTNDLPGRYNYVVFAETAPGTYSYNGFSGTGTPLTITQALGATVTGMPTMDDEGNLVSYLAIEDASWMSNITGASISYSLTINGLPSPPLNTNAFAPNAEGDAVALTVTNSFANAPSCPLRIMKLFDGFPGDRGITAATQFDVKVWNSLDINGATVGNYLLFIPPAVALAAKNSGAWAGTGWTEGTYYCTGNDGANLAGVWQISDEYWRGNPAITDTIPILDLKITGLTNLWPGTYEIRELDFSGNLLSSSPANAWWQAYYNFVQLSRDAPQQQGVLTPGSNYLVYVTNFFQHGEGNIVVSKELRGFPGDWGVTDSTEFTIMIRDMTNNAYMLFDSIPSPIDGTWVHIGSRDVTTGAETIDVLPTGDAIYMFPLSVLSSPQEFSKLYTGNNQHYMVDELVFDGHSAQIFLGSQDITNDGPSGGIVLTPDQTVNVTVLNTYTHLGTGLLMLNKRLAGAWRNFANADTTFSLTMTTDDPEHRTLLFTLDNSNPAAPMYEFMGEVNDAGEYFGVVWNAGGTPTLVGGNYRLPDGWLSEMTFSVNQPILINSLLPGNYEITEDYGTPVGYSISYSISAPVVIEEDNSISLTVTNTYTDLTPPTGGGNNSGTGDYRNVEGWKTSMLLSAVGLLIMMAWVRRQLARPR